MIHQSPRQAVATLHLHTLPESTSYATMLSFPAPQWNTVETPKVTKSKERRPPGSRFGRTASLIVPRVYLSDYFTAQDADELVRLGITHVISAIEYEPAIPGCIPEERRLHVRLPDTSSADILVYLNGTTEFITSALAENETNKVLVRCRILPSAWCLSLLLCNRYTAFRV